MPKRNPNASVRSMDEFMSMEKTVETLIVDSNACNDKRYTALFLSFFSNLKVFEVGDYSFSFMETVELIGLNQLERVTIGKCCFSVWDRDAENPNCHFYLKNCPQVKELKMGRYSFSCNSICGIENNDSLEVIEMGELNEWSFNFCLASLELKSKSDGVM